MGINLLNEIIKENNVLTNCLNKEVKKLGKDDFFNLLICELKLSTSRINFLEEILRRKKVISEFSMNDILRCVVKKLYEVNGSLYNELNLPEGNLYSKNEIYEYDPAKNGQNILKHGLDFSSVVSYGGADYGRLITHTHSNNEDRIVIFSKYYTEEKNNFFLKEDKKNDRFLCIATVAITVGLRFRFISSRALNFNTDGQLSSELRNMIKDENLDEDTLKNLRDAAHTILKDYYKS